MKRFVIFVLTLGLLAPGQLTAEQKLGSDTRLPIPRFVSLRAETANMRIGPSLDHVIDWVYQRPGLPLRVIGEHDSWRQVEDHEATKGWMHRKLLTSKRTVIVMNAIQRLKKDADESSVTLLRVEQGVIGALERCKGDWCQVVIDGHTGWIRRAGLWGISPDD